MRIPIPRAAAFRALRALFSTSRPRTPRPRTSRANASPSTSHSTVVLLLALALLGGGVLGCGDDDGGTDPTPGPTGTADIGPAGGTLTSTDGDLELTVPAGALASTQTLTIEALDAGDLPAAFDGLAIEAAYEIGPAGLSFSAPVQLEFHSDQQPRQGDGSISVGLEAIFTVDDTGALEKLADTEMVADAVENTFSIEATTTHLSPFARVADRATGTSVSAIDVDMIRDTPATEIADLLSDQFSVTTRLSGDLSGSWARAPFTLEDETDGGDATVVGAGTYSFQEQDFTGGMASHQMAYTCAGGRAGQPIEVRVRLGFETSFTGSDRLRLRLQTDCPEDDGGGGGDAPVIVATAAGPELAETFQFSTQSWDDRIGAQLDYMVVAGSQRTQIHDLSDGSIAWEVATGDYYGAVPLASPGADGDFSSGFFNYGPAGAFWIEYDSATGFDHFGQLVEFQNPVWDAYPYDGDIDSGGVSYVVGDFAVRFASYDENDDLQGEPVQIFSSSLDGGGGGSIIGAIRTTFQFRRRAPGDVLIVTAGDGTTGKVYLADSADPGAALTAVADVGSDPRRLRHDGDIAAVSNFGSDDLTVMTWTGNTVTVTEASVAVGDGPVGIDLLRLGTGNVAIASTGFNDDTYTVTIVDADGNLVDSTTAAVPDGGQAPGHASWTTRGQDVYLLISCNGSNEVIPVAVQF